MNSDHGTSSTSAATGKERDERSIGSWRVSAWIPFADLGFLVDAKRVASTYKHRRQSHAVPGVRAVMPPTTSNRMHAVADHDLWARIQSHDFEPEGQALTFTGRLARDHGWTLLEARALVEEYRRFCFLAVTSDGEVTPSQEVDEVWHLHLTFSQDYWDRWCRNALRRPLHHAPTQGGPAEAARFAEQYARTLAPYEDAFAPPDPAYWPGTARRFARARFVTVDRRRAIVVPWPEALRWPSSGGAPIWRRLVSWTAVRVRP